MDKLFNKDNINNNDLVYSLKTIKYTNQMCLEEKKY